MCTHTIVRTIRAYTKQRNDNLLVHLDIGVGLERADALVALLQTHAATQLHTLQATALQSVRDQVQHVDKLTKHNRFGAQVLTLHLV